MAKLRQDAAVYAQRAHALGVVFEELAALERAGDSRVRRSAKLLRAVLLLYVEGLPPSYGSAFLKELEERGRRV